MKTSVGTVKGSLSSPASYPPKPTGSFSVAKNVGPLACTVKSASLPLKGAELGSITVAEKIKSFDCSVVGTVTSKEGKVQIGNGKLSVKKSFDTPAGPVCGVLETSVDNPKKVAGAVSWKKRLGYVCCNLEAYSTGNIRCTFDTGLDLKHGSKATTTPAPEAKPWWGTIFQKSQVSANGAMNVSVVALIGFVVGAGITLLVFGTSRATSTAGEQRLLA